MSDAAELERIYGTVRLDVLVAESARVDVQIEQLEIKRTVLAQEIGRRSLHEPTEA